MCSIVVLGLEGQVLGLALGLSSYALALSLED